jgi:hypothetical protein
MGMKTVPIAAAVLMASLCVMAGPLGIFRGRLVQAPEGQKRNNWIFVQSPKGTLRQVEISQAKISYADDVPVAHRSDSPAADLVPGVEVLVTADQDPSGEWRAREIEILSVRTQRAGCAASFVHLAHL